MLNHLMGTLLFTIAATSVTVAQEEPADTGPELPLIGPARLDLNTAPGDQSQRQTFTVPEPGSTITVDVAVSEGGANRAGFDILLNYDASQIAYQTAQPVDLFDDAFLITLLETGQVGLTGLLLESRTDRSGGSIAHVTFTILDGFPGESRVSLESALLGTALRIDSIQVGTESSVVTLGGRSQRSFWTSPISTATAPSGLRISSSSRAGSAPCRATRVSTRYWISTKAVTSDSPIS